MSNLSNSIIDKFSVEQRQSKIGMLVIFFDKLVSVIKNYLIFLIIPLINDPDLILIIIFILIVTLVTAILTFIEFRYFTFQFDFKNNDFIIKKGFLKKTKLSVPLNKIQQINLNQNFVHKLLNLYEVQMDTAGSDSKEVSIKAVEKNIALDIKEFTDFLKEKNINIEIEKSVENKKLEIGFYTLIKTGLTSRYLQTLGFIVALIFGALEYLDALGINFIPSFSSFIKSGNFGFLAILFYVILIALAVLSSNLISTIVKYFRFSASKSNNNLTISYGLVSTKTILMSPSKVQVFSFTQNWIQKKLDLCNIIIYQASSNMSVGSEKSKDGSKVNIPGANSNDRKTIFEFIFNYQDDKELIIKPNIRKFSVNFLFVGIIPSILFFCLNYFSELLTNLNYIIFQSGYIIIMILISYRLFKNSYLSVSKNYIKAQSGFWDIKTKIIEIHKIQSIVIDQDIWYRKLNLADLTICTAGGMIRFTFINYDVLKKITDNFLYKVEESNKSWM